MNGTSSFQPRHTATAPRLGDEGDALGDAGPCSERTLSLGMMTALKL